MTLATTACLLAILTAVACALCGPFIVANKQAMVIDGISHAALPGIAVGFLFTGDISSPWLLLSAAASGCVIAFLSDWLARNKILNSDAALGLIFPTMFSIGTILISSQLTHVNFSVEAVLVGDLNLVALAHPEYCWVLAVTILCLALFISLLFPRLTVSSFDYEFSTVAGIHPNILHTTIMIAVAFTSTIAFHVVGAMMVLSLMVLPYLCARLLTERISGAVPLTVVIATLTAPMGFWLAYHFNVATSAAMSLFNASLFFIIFIAHKKA